MVRFSDLVLSAYIVLHIGNDVQRCGSSTTSDNKVSYINPLREVPLPPLVSRDSSPLLVVESSAIKMTQKMATAFGGLATPPGT